VPKTNGKGRERDERPQGGDLAVMRVPEFRKQQRADGNTQQDSGKWQRPGPAHRGAVERRCGVGRGGEEQCDREDRAMQNQFHRHWLSSHEFAGQCCNIPPHPEEPRAARRLEG